MALAGEVKASWVAAAVTLAVGIIALNQALVGVFYDDGLYAGLAIALSTGMGYVHPNLPHTPAVVLFRYAPGKDNPHIEPVYNTDVAWPDDAPVIRAHDLGPRRNIEIFRYYPERAFYSCDPRFSEPRFLGYGKYLVTGSSGL